MLRVAALLIALTALAHSVLGERYIIRRLLRRDLPKLFGDDRFTSGTIRFAWHVTSLAWLLFAWLLLVAAQAPPSTFRTQSLVAIAVTAVASAALPLYYTRGRHLSWVVLVVVAALILASLFGA